MDLQPMSDRTVNSVFNLLKIKLGRLSIKDRIKFFLNITNPLYRVGDNIIKFTVLKNGEIKLVCCDKEVKLPIDFTVEDVREALFQLLN